MNKTNPANRLKAGQLITELALLEMEIKQLKIQYLDKDKQLKKLTGKYLYQLNKIWEDIK